MEDLQALFEARGIRRVFIATQSFLGFAAADCCRATPDLVATIAFHTDYPAFFFSRLVSGLPADADRTRYIPIRTAMYRRLCETFLSWTTEAVYPSQHAANVLRCRDRETEIRQVIVPSGVDVEIFRPEGTRVDKPPNAIVCLYAGRLEHDKNIALLPEIDSRLSNVEWWVAGTGSQESLLRSSLRRARFFGQLPARELARLYRSADVIVHPSCAETFGMTVAEAMACGGRVVVADEGAPAALVQHLADGVISPVSAAGFAEAILTVTKDRALSEALGHRAVHTAQQFDWRIVLPRMAEVIVG